MSRNTRQSGARLAGLPGTSQSQMLDERLHVASYVAQLSDEMAHLSSRAGLDLLAYFLRMAQAEAEAIAAEIARPDVNRIKP